MVTPRRGSGSSSTSRRRDATWAKPAKRTLLCKSIGRDGATTNVTNGAGGNLIVDEVTPAAGAVRTRRGRRRSHAEHWTKVTVVLMDRQIIFLDRLVADIRATDGVAISRAHLVRALVDALSESDLDLTGTRSESDLKRILADRMARIPRTVTGI